MKYLVAIALGLACAGYWVYEYRRWERGVSQCWTAQDDKDTADAVARLYDS